MKNKSESDFLKDVKMDVTPNEHESQRSHDSNVYSYYVIKFTHKDVPERYYSEIKIAKELEKNDSYFNGFIDQLKHRYYKQCVKDGFAKA